MTTGSVGGPDFASQGSEQRAQALSQLAAQYNKNPNDRTTTLYYSTALRANGQFEQAIAVLENGVSEHRNDPVVMVAYAKALSAGGRFGQALTIIEGAIDPTAPDWNALLVKGAILDQMGKTKEARKVYELGLKIAPNQPSLYANLGLSYAMTNELVLAETTLRKAAALPGANSQVRQNLALVIGLQGRFDEARAMFAGELPPDAVESNMAYVKSLLTQQNRWDRVAADG
jgi:Flp pilus assembly protein TadD